MMKNPKTEVDIASKHFLDFPDAYIRIGVNGIIQFMNQAAIVLLQSGSPKQALNLTEMLYEDEVSDFVGKLTLVKELGSIGNFTFRTQFNSQNMVFTPNALHDPQGNFIGIHGIVRPEETLSQYFSGIQGDLVHIADKLPFGLAILRANGEIYSNPFLQKLLGLSEIQIAFNVIPQWLERADSDIKKGNREFTYISTSSFPLQKKINVRVVQIPETAQTRLFIAEPGTLHHKSVYTHSDNFPSENGAFDYMSIGVICENANADVIMANQKMLEVLSSTQKIDLHQNLSLKDFLFRVCLSTSKAERISELCCRLRRSNKEWAKDILDLGKGKKIEIMTWVLYNDDDKNYMGRFWSFSDLEKSPSINDIKPIIRNRYGRIIEDMNIGLIEIDQESNIQMTNKAFLDMMGFSDYDVLQKQPSHILDLEIPHLKKKLNEKNTPLEISLNNRSFLVFSAPRVSVLGHTNGRILVFYDNTMNKKLICERQDLIHELEERNRVLQEYAHMVSHDLKAPLRSIHALCSWLIEDYPLVLGEEGSKTLGLLQKKALRMEHLIRDILGYSTLKKQNFTDLIDPNKIVSNVLTLIDVPHSQTIQIPKPLPLIQAHKTRMHQVFQNLLTNALEHIDSKDGRIVLTATEINNYWEFSISDNGRGIPKEYHKTIFTIYQTYKKSGSTSGLGLSIVKKIIDLHKGNIWIDDSYTNGTKVTFTIPKSG